MCLVGVMMVLSQGSPQTTEATALDEDNTQCEHRKVSWTNMELSLRTIQAAKGGKQPIAMQL